MDISTVHDKIKTMDTKITIEYGDNIIDIIRKFKAALLPHGLDIIQSGVDADSATEDYEITELV